MNKSASLIINLVLAIAVAVLYVLHFQSGSNAKPVSAAPVNPNTAGEDRIVYVDIDSLQRYYKFFNDIADQIDQKGKAQQLEMRNRSVAFQQKVGDFQEKVQKRLVTQREAEKMQTDLAKEEQKLRDLEIGFSNLLMDYQSSRNRVMYDSINSFLNDYNASRGYKYIMLNSELGGMLYADRALDVTQEVISGLNARYEGK